MAKNSQLEKGVVLVIALIMMAVIAISSAAAIRSVMTQDKIGLNQRLQVLARSSAESMLRYCEAAISADVPTSAQQQIINRIQPAVTLPTPQAWMNIDNWSNASIVNMAPSTFDGNGYVTGRRPECLVEGTGLQSSNVTRTGDGTTSSNMTVAIVTARGFSPDYAETTPGIVTAGAVAWVQSSIHVPNR